MVQRSAPVMGTVAVVDVRDERDGVEEAIDAALLRLWQLEDVFSTFDAESQVSRLNAGTLTLADAGAEVRDVLAACSWLEQESGGAFRARRPDGTLDPAGFVKGWAVDRAGDVLRAHGMGDWSLNVGGDVRTSGRPEPGRDWQIGVRDPLDASAVVVVVRVGEGAIATSGTYERGRHLWDGRTGGAADGVASMTVVGPELAWADAFATTAFVLGATDGLAFVGRFGGYEGFAVRLDGELTGTPGFRERLAR